MKTILLSFSAAALLLTGGCASRVIFMTDTSLGLDVSGTANYPNKVSVSHNRYEAAIIPRKTDGDAHSVYGSMDADMTFFHGHVVKQTFATGEAARRATGTTSGTTAPTTNAAKGSLIFFTGTTYGLMLSAGEKQMSPNLLMGYRRTEASIIPVPDPAQEVRSVFADIVINTSEERKSSVVTTNFSQLGGVRIKQSFATGGAAEALAATASGRAKLAEATGLAATADLLNQNSIEAEKMIADIAGKLDGFNDSQLNSAVDALKTVGFETNIARLDSIRGLAREEKAANLKKKFQKKFTSPEDLARLLLYLAELNNIQ